MTKAQPTMGFAGLGALGSALAEKIEQEGNLKAVWNRSPAACLPFENRGIIAAPDLPALSANCDWLFSCVADDEALLSISRAIAAAPKKPALHVSFATCSPAAVLEARACLADARVAFVNAPVMGRPDVVRAGQAGFLLAGPVESTDKLHAFLSQIGARVHDAGTSVETAAALKLAINYLIAATIGGLSEAFVALAGLDNGPGLLLDVISNSPLSSPLIQMFGNNILDHRFRPPLFDLEMAQKDIRYFTALSGPNTGGYIAEAVASHMERTRAQATTPIDWSGLAEHLFLREEERVA